jgi:predicted nucleic acid-binding protein
LNPGNNEEEMRPSSGEEHLLPFLLDTSALFTFIEDEDGADRVEQALNQVTTLVPWTVLMETYYITLQEEGQAEADRRIALIRTLKVRILWDMNESMLLTAAKLKAEYRISLADAIIAAYAIRYNAVLIHKDPEFEALTGLLRMEALPYTSASQ